MLYLLPRNSFQRKGYYNMDDKESEEMMREIGEQIMFQLSYAKSPESFESTNNSELSHATGGA